MAGCGKKMAASPFIPSDTAKTVTIVTKWNLKADSIYYKVGNSNASYIVYNGLADDYWDIRTDGNIYIKEGFTSDTLGYILLSDSTILINSFGLILNADTAVSTIQNLTVHQAIIKSNTIPNPGGQYLRTVYLQR
jgi:hypothetical protein